MTDRADPVDRGLRAWRESGVPRNPEGWLYRVALNARRDVWKSAAARTSVAFDPEVHDEAGHEIPAEADPEALPDRRLELLTACAHPDIDPGVRPLLMLSAVMGLTGRQIASAMTLPAATVAARLPDVCEAIYGAFAIDWVHSTSQPREGMIGEAIFLSGLLARLCPGDGESHGLAALVHLSAARFPARRGEGGAFVPLAEQDPEAWNTSLVTAGEHHLREVHRCGHVGRFGLEAGIQILHMTGVRRGETDWPMLLRLHDDLDRIAPSLGGSVARVAVLAEADGPTVALAALEALDSADRRLTGFQPAWVLRAHLLTRLDRRDEATAAHRRALELTTDPAERDYLTRLPRSSD